MTNQVNKAFEKWKNSFFITTGCYPNAESSWKAATQASESEINSLKQRVEELESQLNTERELHKQIIENSNKAWGENELLKVELSDSNRVLAIRKRKSFEKRIVIDELTASNNQLREALGRVHDLLDKTKVNPKDFNFDYIEQSITLIESTLL